VTKLKQNKSCVKCEKNHNWIVVENVSHMFGTACRYSTSSLDPTLRKRLRTTVQYTEVP